MFGYIRIYKDELKIREFNLFRSYYCGLCKTLKREYGFASRMGLSYDVTFLALLLSSVQEEKAQVVPERCIANPFHKKPVCIGSDYLDYTAAINVILMSAKLADDWHDEHSLRSFFCMPLLWRAKRKVKRQYSEVFLKVTKHLNNLSKLEKEKCAEVDRLAHEFALIMQIVFEAHLLQEQERRIISHIGYCLGRFIYILDAYEDREKDKKEKNFNPFLLSKDKIDSEEIKNALFFTLSDVSNSYQLLNLKANKAILDNIIYLGLPESLNRVFCGSAKESKEKNK